MSAKELKEKYGHLVDMAFFKRNIEVSSEDLSAMLDMAELAEEYYENCKKVDGLYVSPKDIGQEISMLKAALAAAMARLVDSNVVLDTAGVAAVPVTAHMMHGDNGPEIPDASRGGDGPSGPPGCYVCRHNHWGKCP